MARCLKRTTDPAFSSARGNPLTGSTDHVIVVAGERFRLELLAFLHGNTSISEGFFDRSYDTQRVT